MIMKTLPKIWGTGILLLALMLAVPQKSKAQYGNDISFQTFYDELSPYGIWIDDPDYGNVWVPDVQDDFRPYATNGHWVVTGYGNTWVSDYDWGWAPFHYGRWRFDDYYGWEWIPDYEWGPAWVNWRHGGGYYGWAPLGPGISVDIMFGGGYRAPDNYWVFAPEGYINRPNIYNYYVPRTRVVNIIHNTTIINNTYINNGTTYVVGPRPRDIEQVTHTRVTVYNINNASRPSGTVIQNNTVNIYRPAVKQTVDARPVRVIDARAYREANPNQRIAVQGGARANRDNAAQLVNFARTAPADNKIIRVNERPNNTGGGRPEQPRTDGQPTPINRPGQPAMYDRQRQPQNQQGQPQQQQQAQPAQQQATPQQPYQQRGQRPQVAQPQTQPAQQQQAVPAQQQALPTQQQATPQQQYQQRRQRVNQPQAQPAAQPQVTPQQQTVPAQQQTPPAQQQRPQRPTVDPQQQQQAQQQAAAQQAAQARAQQQQQAQQQAAAQQAAQARAQQQQQAQQQARQQQDQLRRQQAEAQSKQQEEAQRRQQEEEQKKTPPTTAPN
jgi:hypothetical protein